MVVGVASSLALLLLLLLSPVGAGALLTTVVGWSSVTVTRIVLGEASELDSESDAVTRTVTGFVFWTVSVCVTASVIVEAGAGVVFVGEGPPSTATTEYEALGLRAARCLLDIESLPSTATTE